MNIQPSTDSELVAKKFLEAADTLEGQAEARQQLQAWREEIADLKDRRWLITKQIGEYERMLRAGKDAYVLKMLGAECQ